ncbi:MAG: exodeoxyribonuclease VII large subunit [Mycobacteriales bacterium]
MTLQSSPSAPLPVRTVAAAIAGWVGRLGQVWVEGQLTQVDLRGGTAFLVLRDPVAQVSLRATCPRTLIDGLRSALPAGSRVVVCGRPQLHLARGSLALSVTDVRPVGVGELLARLERLRATLAAEGLFAAERKRPLPFVPAIVGLVTGRAGAAESDVKENALRRWPAVRFEVRNVSVQGPYAVAEVIAAVRELDELADVDVIVVARGGGSLEDLLPFSDETLCRSVAACRTPVVSAIGHEGDTPLLDLVADRRASTPTDAGKLVVPDVTEQRALVRTLRERAGRAFTQRLDRDRARLVDLCSRPVLARPLDAIARRQDDLDILRNRGRRATSARLDAAAREVEHARARVAALSPEATLARGYAIIQDAGGQVIRDSAATRQGDRVHARLAVGSLELLVEEVVSPVT